MTDEPTKHNGRRHPANIEPYVDVLGEIGAAQLFLKLGGSRINLPMAYTQAESLLVNIVGSEKALALGKRIGWGYIKVPIASRWIAEILYRNGASVADIARKVRCDESTVHRWLNQKGIAA